MNVCVRVFGCVCVYLRVCYTVYVCVDVYVRLCIVWVLMYVCMDVYYVCLCYMLRVPKRV